MLTIVLHATVVTLGIFTGIAIGLLIIAALALGVHRLWDRTRWTRPAWWLRRRRPTLRGRA